MLCWLKTQAAAQQHQMLRSRELDCVAEGGVGHAGMSSRLSRTDSHEYLSVQASEKTVANGMKRMSRTDSHEYLSVQASGRANQVYIYTYIYTYIYISYLLYYISLQFTCLYMYNIYIYIYIYMYMYIYISWSALLVQKYECWHLKSCVTAQLFLCL
jgi:hypothetical protein